MYIVGMVVSRAISSCNSLVYF